MHQRGSGGGVDRFFWGLFDALSAGQSIRAHAFFFQHGRASIESRPLESCLGPTDAPAALRLWRLRRAVLTEIGAAKAEPLVVASHFAFYAASLLPRLGRLRHVVHFQGPWATESATEGFGRSNVAAKRLIERAVYATADAFITLSHAFREMLISEYRIDPARVYVIPPAVDVQRFSQGDRSIARERLGWPRDVKIILCVRRLVRRMGLENLLEAFSELASKHPDSVLFFGGTGTIRRELEARIQSHGLGDRVRLIGFIPDPDLATAYQAADCSIVPSQSLEGFGLTTLESLACGTPVFVTPVGGLPEAVSKLEPRLVLPGTTGAAIAERLGLFLGAKLPVPSPDECRRYVKANFSWPKITKQVREVYWRVATGEKG